MIMFVGEKEATIEFLEWMKTLAISGSAGWGFQDVERAMRVAYVEMFLPEWVVSSRRADDPEPLEFDMERAERAARISSSIASALVDGYAAFLRGIAPAIVRTLKEYEATEEVEQQ